jgi:hypothetical protein
MDFAGTCRAAGETQAENSLAVDKNQAAVGTAVDRKTL